MSQPRSLWKRWQNPSNKKIVLSQDLGFLVIGGGPLFQGRTDGAKRDSRDRTAKIEGELEQAPGHTSHVRGKAESGKLGRMMGSLSRLDIITC